ncbi:OmpA family protein [Psychrobacter jeotgali]|uniref:OmpA family protein n=1 Tax=Psychrobacter jeotgali TaxID=179010 RepID=UPI00191A3E3A|nr:OmpA family protein [Psychrobacter jeotgali]
MSYNPLKDPSIYDDAYAKKSASSYQDTETEDPKKNKKWPMKTPGLPQYVYVTYHTAKTLGYDQLFPNPKTGLVLQHKREFTQTNFINFYVSTKDGFKANLTESDYEHFVTKTGREKILDQNLKLFYQKGLDKATKIGKFNHLDTNEQIIVPKLIYKPNLQVGGQDLRLSTRQKTRIEVTSNRDSFISRGKVVAISWRNPAIDFERKGSMNNHQDRKFYEAIGGNDKNILSPSYPALMELVFRQLQTKDVMEATLPDDPKDVGKSDLAIAANYLLNLNEEIEVYSELKRANTNRQTSYRRTDFIKSDKDYVDKSVVNGHRSYPPVFVQSNKGQWSFIYKRDLIGHSRVPKSSEAYTTIVDELNELVTPQINLTYITDGSNFPNELGKKVDKNKAIQDLIKIAKTVNAALFFEPTIGVAIIGHTDCEASFKYNLKLSKDRATSIQDYLCTLSKDELGGIENLLKDEGRTKTLGAGMLDCRECWDDETLRKKTDMNLWNNSDCRRISFEFYLIN